MTTTQEQITAERHRSADLLETLDEDQLRTPSLCGSWTVRDVFAHELMPLVTPIGRFAVAMIKARGSFDKANDALSRKLAATRSPADLAAGLGRAGKKFIPRAGLPARGLARRPGRAWAGHPSTAGSAARLRPDVLRKALDFLTLPKAQPVFVAKGRLAGRVGGPATSTGLMAPVPWSKAPPRR